MLLIKYGAKASGSLSDFEKRMAHQCVSSSEALLGQCITEVSGELLVFDFDNFKETTESKNEMDLHTIAMESEKSELLLHPLMQIFLDLKWNQVRKYYWCNLFIDIIFLICLTFSACQFLSMTYCQPCDESDDTWSMNINHNVWNGKEV